jgi:hypothetical protein
MQSLINKHSMNSTVAMILHSGNSSFSLKDSPPPLSRILLLGVAAGGGMMNLNDNQSQANTSDLLKYPKFQLILKDLKTPPSAFDEH